MGSCHVQLRPEHCLLGTRQRTPDSAVEAIRGKGQSCHPRSLKAEQAARPNLESIGLNSDEYQAQSQAQVAASLNAFGSTISLLLGPEVRQLLAEETNPALRQLADGFYLLTDHQHRLSLARRAFIKPSLSLIGKNAAENAPVDEWLLGAHSPRI